MLIVATGFLAWKDDWEARWVRVREDLTGALEQ